MCFLSIDIGTTNSWKKGIDRFQIEGEHYFMPGRKERRTLVNFLNLWWIPRYVVVNEIWRD